MAVNACTFVEPAIAETGVHADDDEVLASVVEEVRDIEAEGRVAVVVAANEISVDEKQGVAESTVELKRYPAAAVAGRNIEAAAIPSDAGFGITPPQRLVSVALQALVANKWQLDCPVMWQIQIAPFRVIKLIGREFELARLRKIALSAAQTEVACGITAVAELKFPSEIKEQVLARSDRGDGFCRCRAGIRGQKGVGSGDKRACGQ